MRYAIWTAVSTEAQAAPEKVSLKEQETKCRAYATARGWKETTGPYTAPGISRTRWVNLSDAARAIPDLSRLLTDAQNNKYDLLIIYDYTRLRTLLEPLAKTLSAYGIQLLSISQPIEIIPPAQYDPTTADTASIVQFAAGFTSQAEIASLKRRYRLGMPNRITQKGLPKGKAPYGYRKPIGHETDRQAVPEQDPIKAAVVIKIKDLYLSGKSLWQIANQLTAEHIPTPAGNKKWRDVNVRLILKNKLYCGTLTFGATRRIVDPLSGRVDIIPNHPSKIITAKGKHKPLWNDRTQHAIEAEFKRRGRAYTGMRTQRFSNLLYCQKCGSRLWMEYPGGKSDKTRRYACNKDPKHITIKETDITDLFIKELLNAIKRVQTTPAAPLKDPRPELQKQNAALTEQLNRISTAYETGVYEIDQYITRSEPIKQQIAQNQQLIENWKTDQQNKTAQRNTLLQFAKNANLIPAYIKTNDPQQVNNQLRAIIKSIHIGTGENIKIDFI